MSITSQRAAAIRRAEAAAQKATTALDAGALRELETIYKEASLAIREQILNAASPDGTLVVEVLRPLLSQIEQLMAQVGAQRDALLGTSMQEAATLGANIMRAESAVVSISMVNAAQDALEFVVNFTAEDGLQLSDRLWRLNQGATKTIGDVIKQGIIQGMDATQATDAILSANAAEIAKNAGNALIIGEGSPRSQAMRLVRTEINRAHGEAFKNAAFEHPDVIGTKFNLSPSHPRKDICDMHSKVNRYGLGNGVYPKGRSPWPAHPNTLSYESVVFKDEVTDADRAGKEDRIAWLKKQSTDTQVSVLGKGKAGYLQSGDLSERMIRSKLSNVIKRVEKAKV
jgi:hypothetical protein